MNTEEIPEFLSRRVPAIAAPIQEAIADVHNVYGPDAPLSDHVLGTVLVPLAADLLRSDSLNARSVLTALFMAVDELLGDPNPNVG